MKRATETAWVKASGDELVGDGDPEAALLFAVKGQCVTDADAAAFTNADSFFETATMKEARVVNTAGGPFCAMAIDPPPPPEPEQLPGSSRR